MKQKLKTGKTNKREKEALRSGAGGIAASSIEKSLSPYSKIWTSTLFGRLFIRTYGRNNSKTPARRSRR